jgi:hypothetical protein
MLRDESVVLTNLGESDDDVDGTSGSLRPGSVDGLEA